MLKRILSEIEACLKNNCFVAALALSLAIPDICGNVEYPKLRGREHSKERYIKWFDEHIGQYEKCSSSKVAIELPYTNGEIVYALRNSLFHQGNSVINAQNIKKECCKISNFSLIIDDFICGGSSSAKYDENGNVSERSLEINIVNLCEKIVLTAEDFYLENQNQFTDFNCSIKDFRKRK